LLCFEGGGKPYWTVARDHKKGMIRGANDTAFDEERGVDQSETNSQVAARPDQALIQDACRRRQRRCY
jgi:hypothetical protein